MEYGASIPVADICEKLTKPPGKEATWDAYAHGLVYCLLCGASVLILKRYFRWCASAETVRTVCYFPIRSWTLMAHSFFSGLVDSSVLIPRLKPDLSGMEPFLPSISASVIKPSKPFCVAPSVGRLVHRIRGRKFRLVVNSGARYASVFTPRIQSNPGCSNSCVTYGGDVYNLVSVNQRLKLVNGLAEFLQRIRTESEEFMYPPPNKTHLMKELRWFLEEATVQFGGRLYAFTKGLPQGSCVSSDLTSLYLAHADRKLLESVDVWSHKNRLSETAVLRYVDDYLCISSSKESLNHLIDRIRTNDESYGLAVNESKFQSNLDDSDLAVNWLGMDIDSSLALVIPVERLPIFCRFAGQPLAPKDCVRRLATSRLQCLTWRYAFQLNPEMVHANSPGNHTAEVLRLNAQRLGTKMADIVWVSVKTSPDRAQLLQPAWSKRLASKLLYHVFCLFRPACTLQILRGLGRTRNPSSGGSNRSFIIPRTQIYFP
ncbi:unnamed protein product [Calicophoron daubneyi]|uniref:Telomerase reverse transcriptase n=1 Tax=Calicophoron daubneyi TaxID=300641 RepID=A0AAV2TGY1_CALDB